MHHVYMYTLVNTKVGILVFILTPTHAVTSVCEVRQHSYRLATIRLNAF